MDRKFRVVGTVGYVHSGLTKQGDEYQLIKVSGFTFFLPPAHRNGWKQGQMVEVSGEYRGDRYIKRTDSYQPEFDIEYVAEVAAATA